MIDRRGLVIGLGGAALAGCKARTRAGQVVMPFGAGERTLAVYPGKRPLIRLTARPPQLETPFAVFNEGVITPNDAFFVRYHLAGLPTEIDLDAYRLKIGGLVDRPLSLTLDELKAMPATELVAVNQCSGNSRGFFDPRVAGGQLGNGAMGNARWTGAPLKAVLDRAGVRAGARQVSFAGLDGPVDPATPDFAKALDIDHARDGEVMLAWGMNGADLPFLNGFPLRLIVPGWYGTYWVKHLSEIMVLDHDFDGFWMKTAYRIPDNPCACVPPGTKPDRTRPIGRFDIRSFVTSHADGARVDAGKPIELKGVAFDGGDGIASVEVSTDGGRSWRQAALGQDLGRYSFREWRLTADLARGEHALKVRATGRRGETQPDVARWNPAGYMRNVVETVTVRAA
jgi:DMSO/TMAO reductase YedYZ molybdopterin-dependent catalytic subunit